MRELESNLNRLEWLFPIRGRWLRFLLSVSLALGASWYGIHFRQDLPTFVDTARGFQIVRSQEWGFWASGGLRMNSHQSHSLTLGPVRIYWSTRDSEPHPRSEILRLALDILALTAGGVGIFWLLRYRTWDHANPLPTEASPRPELQ